MPQEPRYPEKGAKLDHVIQLQLQGNVHGARGKLENNQNMGELQQPRKKNDPSFRRAMINS